MKKIKLIQGAYIEGYEGAFLEMVSEDGKNLLMDCGIIGIQPQPKMKTVTCLQSIEG